MLTDKCDGDDVNQDLYDGILSGGLSPEFTLKSYHKVLSAIKLSQKGPLRNLGGEEKGEALTALTEEAFLSIVNLVGFNTEI